MTGIYARSDVARGVFKAPANEVVNGLTKFEININKARQDVLNPEGINALRFFEGRGNRVWGARTMSSDPEWKYVNVRRLFIYLEHSIDKSTQWAVFEPNNERLWANIRSTIEDFLLVQWKSGALLGTKPEQAYFVRCDRTTMTQNDLDNGRLICLIGVAPTYPAEFVIFRIGQWTADASYGADPGSEHLMATAVGDVSRQPVRRVQLHRGARRRPGGRLGGDDRRRLLGRVRARIRGELLGLPQRQRAREHGAQGAEHAQARRRDAQARPRRLDRPVHLGEGRPRRHRRSSRRHDHADGRGAQLGRGVVRCRRRSRRNGSARRSRPRAAARSRWRSSTWCTKASSTNRTEPAVAVSSIAPLVLGAPGIYRAPDNPIRALTGVRMDVCAFVGVAPRGPARVPYTDEELLDATWAPVSADAQETEQLAVPVAVESWSAYVQRFGSFEGPGLLPYAVASFFDNGGQRAYIVRIVHRYPKPDGTPDTTQADKGISRGVFAGLTASGGRRVWVRARNEGSWGSALRARCRSRRARWRSIPASDFFINRVRVPIGLDIGPGTTLRLLLGAGVRTIRRVTSVVEDWNPPDGSREKWAWSRRPDGRGRNVGGTGRRRTRDRRRREPDRAARPHRAGVEPSAVPRVRARERLGSAVSIRRSGDTLRGDPLASWLDSDLERRSDPRAVSTTAPFTVVPDRYPDIVPDDFFDDDWIPGDERSARGIHSIVDLDEVSLVVAPDLYSPAPLAPLDLVIVSPTLAGPDFAECVEAAAGRRRRAGRSRTSPGCGSIR